MITMMMGWLILGMALLIVRDVIVSYQARVYARLCGDEDVLVPDPAWEDRPCVPRYETYRDWTLLGD